MQMDKICVFHEEKMELPEPSQCHDTPENAQLDVLMTKRRNSIANALAFRLSKIKPSICIGVSPKNKSVRAEIT